MYFTLILLDASSVFDTVDHDILIAHLQNYVGISDVGLNWFISYLSTRPYSEMHDDASSSSYAFPFC